MATHGTMLVRRGNDTVFLWTPHDGHTDSLWDYLKKLPEACAERDWRAEVLGQHPPVTRERFANSLKSVGPIALGDPLTFANLFVQTQPLFDCWKIVPPEYKTGLARYDQKPDVVVVLRDYEYVIRQRPAGGERDRIDETVPWYDLYVDGLVAKALRLKPVEAK
jgi:hypothetical protein